MDAGQADRPYRTDQQNYIVDCHFRQIEEPYRLAAQLAEIPGIAEHGLFIDYADAALAADAGEIMVLRQGHATRPLSRIETLP
jgi:ribose 5-phosphate isomerase A